MFSFQKDVKNNNHAICVFFNSNFPVFFKFIKYLLSNISLPIVKSLDLHNLFTLSNKVLGTRAGSTTSKHLDIKMSSS